VPSKPIDPSRKIMAVTISADAHKVVRMVAATNDLTHEKVIEFALLHLKRSYPDYELNLQPEVAIAPPSFRPVATKAKRQAAE
jgi:hypothetical protein